MHEDFLDLHHQRQLRGSSLQCHRCQEVRLPGDETPAIDAQGLVDVGNQEKQADVPVGQDVPVSIDPLVAEPVREGDGAVVDDSHHSRRVALRRDIALPVGIGRGDQEEWRAGDEVPHQRRERGGMFGGDDRRRHPVDGIEVLARPDTVLAQSRELVGVHVASF
jgi:hypothetical protein